MGDDAGTGGKRRNGLSIFLGIVGAVLGFVGGMALAPYNRMDPIASGMIALFVFGPMGAVAGAFLGVTLGRRGRGAEAVAATESAGEEAVADTPAASSPPGEASAPGNPARSFGNVLFVVVAIAGAVGVFIYLNHKPPEDFSLNPGGPNPVLQFEVRLPAGAPMPAEKDIRASLHSPPHDQRDMWTTMKPELFRRDGERVVLVGEAEIAHRTAIRQIQMEIANNKFDEVFYLTLPATPPHTNELGAWQPRRDSEIRYRAKWPGRD